jgi:hypothetical protein
MGKKGISSVVAMIIITLITVALGGTAYFFASGIFSSKTSDFFSIIDSYNNTLRLRNMGTEPIKQFQSVTVDGQPGIYELYNESGPGGAPTTTTSSTSTSTSSTTSTTSSSSTTTTAGPQTITATLQGSSSNMDDTFVYNNHPDGDPTNVYGDDNEMIVEHAAAMKLRMYKKFDISSPTIIPAGITITNATLCLYKTYMMVLTSESLPIYHVYTQNWMENITTWNNEPCGPLFNDNIDCNLTVVSRRTTSNQIDEWDCWDVTPSVIADYQSGNQNTSYGVKSDMEGGGWWEAHWATKEWANQLLRPYLNVTYVVQPPTTSTSTSSTSSSTSTSSTSSTSSTTTSTILPFGSIPAGGSVEMKIYNSMQPGTHTVRICTQSTCQVFYITILQ